MKNSDISAPLFLEAVEAIDAGDLSALNILIGKNPHLVSERLANTGDGYFSNPYLLWFVADNP